ncbi:hypothetical protein [Rhizobium sp.]
MRHSIARLAAALFILLSSVGALRAADVENSMPNDLVIKGAPTRYVDLARHFVPDLMGDADGYNGSKMIDIRHLGGPDFANGDATTFAFYDVAHLMTKVDGKDRLLVLFDFSQASSAAQGVAVLALYDVSGNRPELLDAADVGFDASTSFFDQALLPISDGTNAVLTLSSHFNASQSYATQSMILVRNDRFELIDSISLLGERSCGSDRQQTIAYAANPAAGKPYAPIQVAVTDTTSAIEEECADLKQTQLGTRVIKASYVWDPVRNRYLPDSDALAELEKENESRY